MLDRHRLADICPYMRRICSPWFAEAAVRSALDEAAPLYRDAPEAKMARASAARQ